MLEVDTRDDYYCMNESLVICILELPGYFGVGLMLVPSTKG